MNTEIKNSLEAFGAWAHKIADFPFGRGSKSARFNPPKPCDVVGMYGMVGFGIETKQIKKFEAFGLRNLQDSQIENLDKIVSDRRGRAFVFLNIRIAPDKEEGQVRENRLIIFDWEDWKPRWMEQTIKAAELRQMPFLQGKHDLFNLSGFLERVKNHDKMF